MWKFLVFLVVLVLIELPLFRLGAQYFGTGRAWVLLLASAALGLWMIFRGVSFRSLLERDDVSPRDLLIEPVSHVLCGVLLFVPGFLSDAIGLVLLIPPFRRAAAALLIKAIGKKALTSGRVSVRFGMGAQQGFPGAPEQEASPIEDDSPSEERVQDVQFEVLDAPPDEGHSAPGAGDDGPGADREAATEPRSDDLPK